MLYFVLLQVTSHCYRLHKEVNSEVKALKKARENSEIEFHKIFVSASKLGRNLHGATFILNQPHITGRQVHQENVHTSTAEEYYRISYYNEFLSHCILELEERFIANSLSVSLLNLLPSQYTEDDNTDIDAPTDLMQAVNFYQNDLLHPVMFPNEYRIWVRLWQQGSNVPKKLIDVYHSCDPAGFPNIHILLQIVLTLPVRVKKVLPN